MLSRRALERYQRRLWERGCPLLPHVEERCVNRYVAKLWKRRNNKR